jgi:hypothetical protein
MLTDVIVVPFGPRLYPVSTRTPAGPAPLT